MLKVFNIEILGVSIKCTLNKESYFLSKETLIQIKSDLEKNIRNGKIIDNKNLIPLGRCALLYPENHNKFKRLIIAGGIKNAGDVT